MTDSPQESNHELFDLANIEWESGNTEAAFNLFKSAAEQGDIYAFNSIGYFFESGLGTTKDIDSALFWYKKSARNGDVVAQANIGLLYRDKGNYRQAKRWLREAINSGDADAAIELAKLYLSRKNSISLSTAKSLLHLAITSKSISDEGRSEAKSLLEMHLNTI